MALAKFYKRKDKPLSQLEEQVGKAILEMEKVSAESKALLKGLLVDNVKEVEITENGKKAKSIILVTIPFVCIKAMQKSNKFVITQLEKKLKVHVTMTAKRNI